ncbi:hypothetical protein CFIMG_007927RA00001 [Ceratocystis fimbriata CBS 114723]|uniref:Uncharacterized protein n=1 Tax=Ceratocystis fimbriata CBS 114723 TaxID=1035309 RepID=A0A2C5WSK7_9PEZI|nr:hypothetical protein CFIMG_007927RA00001 [Ceratocystis fimbriata CBS 114723]
MYTPLNIPLPTVGLLPILEPESTATYPRWKETAMGFAKDYGFADYLRTPLGTVTEEQYLLLTDGPAKALRAKRFFQAYLHEEFETMYIEAYPKLNMVRHINGNLGSPTYAVETRNTTPVAMATVKQDDKKKKKKKGNNPHHPKGVHDDEECREHPDKKKATEPSTAVTIGRSAGTALFTPALSSIEGIPFIPTFGSSTLVLPST